MLGSSGKISRPEAACALEQVQARPEINTGTLTWLFVGLWFSVAAVCQLAKDAVLLQCWRSDHKCTAYISSACMTKQSA